ncbi:MAG: hypothetical protein ACI9SP_003751 [Arenicella sp.]|jgi:hypothetical protein
MRETMKKRLLISSILSALILSDSAFARSYAFVSNGHNDGQGSLRAALQSGAQTIRISSNVSTIIINSGLQFNGNGRLRIQGNGQVIDGSAIGEQETVLSITNGANVAISSMSFIGSADSVNDNPSEPTGGKGIFVQVPIDRTGIVKVSLSDVSVFRVGHHGVHVSDCSLGDDCGGGSGGGGEGSSASIFVKLDNVTINGVGFGRADADGVRVDDRGEGDIYFAAYNSTFSNIGADGVELDEGNNGNVVADVRNSVFDRNGEYCNLVSEFEGGPCDDDGDRDVDDGFDIDEAGAGTIYARVRNTQVTNNYDEGLDFDEEDEGDISMRLNNVLASNNQDEAVKASEEGAGNLNVTLLRVTTVDNNGAKEGIELEEADDGDVVVSVISSSLIGGDDEKLKIEQGGEGEGVVNVRGSQGLVLDLDGVDAN